MNTHLTWRQRTPALALAGMLALSSGALAACGSNSTTAPVSSTTATTTNTAAQVQLRTAMEQLWMQHMEWTWSTVVAFTSGSPGLTPTLNRLLTNQSDIGTAITPYYGQAAATALTDLLTTHIKDAVPVLTAAKAGNTAALNQAVTAWYANAADIANFLAKANPNSWPLSMTGPMMKEHITQTIAYATDLLQGKYADAITAYNKAEAHMVQMADMLSSGIIAQFPSKF